MNGIIVKQPYADQIISGEKKWEYRTRKLPTHYTNIPLYLLSRGYALGVIRFTKDLSFNGMHQWKISVVRRFARPKRYNHTNGVQVWHRNVILTGGFT